MGRRCDRCAGEAFTKAGRDRLGRQLWRGQACARRLTARSASAVSGYRVPDEILALAVRWYLRFRLSDADRAEWLAERGIRVTTDKAQWYPPALRAVLPHVEHRSAPDLKNGLERDHQQGKGRTRPMRHFKPLARAHTFCQGHALIRHLRQGFSDLTADVSPRLRLAAAWTVLAAGL